MKGFGDLVEIITKWTGIKLFVKFLSKVFKFDCGCDQRKEKLNVELPFKYGTRKDS
jgi:hypothetical protein